MTKINLSQFTNIVENEKLNDRVMSDGNYKYSVLTVYDGKIYACDARDGYIDPSTQLVDVKKYWDTRKLVAASGDNSLFEKNQNQVFSQTYQTILEEAKKQKEVVDNNPGIPVHKLIAAAGNIIDTGYETVRRVNYLLDVEGQNYLESDYNAMKACKVENVSDTNFKYFRKSSSLLQGIKELGDHATPPVARQTFAAIEKSLYADSFRYEFSSREKRDAVFSLENEIRAEIPGLMARMKDEKITTPLNALSDSGAISPDWDAVTGNFYDADAAGDIEADEDVLAVYKRPLLACMPRNTFRLYWRNVQAALIAEPSKSVASGESGRNGTLPKNPSVNYIINDDLTNSTYIIVAVGAYARFFRGPVINVSYQNQMTPGQVSGRIIFDFNGFSEDNTSAARRHTSVT